MHGMEIQAAEIHPLKKDNHSLPHPLYLDPSTDSEQTFHLVFARFLPK